MPSFRNLLRSRRLYVRLLFNGLLLFLVSGFARETLGLNETICEVYLAGRQFWRGALEVFDRAPLVIEALVGGLDLLVYLLALRAVGSYVKNTPTYLDALVLLRVSLRQGIITFSNVQLRLLIGFPVSVTALLLSNGVVSLLGLSYAMVVFWYLGTAVNPRRLARTMELLHRALAGVPQSLDGNLDGGGEQGM